MGILFVLVFFFGFFLRGLAKKMGISIEVEWSVEKGGGGFQEEREEERKKVERTLLTKCWPKFELERKIRWMIDVCFFLFPVTTSGNRETYV